MSPLSPLSPVSPLSPRIGALPELVVGSAADQLCALVVGDRRGRWQIERRGDVTDRAEPRHHVDGGVTRRRERRQQLLPSSQQLVDLLPGEIAAAGQLAEHPLAVRAGRVDHLAALILDHPDLRLGVGRGIAAPAGGIELGLLADAGGIIGRLAQDRRRALLRLRPHARRRLPRRLQDMRRLLAQQARRRVVVDQLVRRTAPSLGVLGLQQRLLEPPLTVMQAGDLGSDQTQELANLVLIEPLARGPEVGARHRGR